MRYGKLQNTMRHADRGTQYSVLRTQYAVLHLSSKAFGRRAVTLIEMLIVLFIVALLAVMALRALPGEDQKPREAARMLNGYISAAKNTAATTGKPAGIILHPWTENNPTDTYPNYSTLVDQCEVPPTYSGELIPTQILATDWTIVPDASMTAMVPYTAPADARPVIKLLIPMLSQFPENMIRYGDQIQINGQGPVYTICWDGPSGDGLYSAPPAVGGTMIIAKNPNASKLVPPAPLLSETDSGKTWPQDYNFPAPKATNGYISCMQAAPDNVLPSTTDASWIGNFCLTCYLDPRNKVNLPWPKASMGQFFSPIPPFSFNIIRQPVKSAVTPLQLPAGAGVDLLYSGVDNGPLFYPGNAVGNPPKASQIGILFSPSGSVEALNLNGTLAKPTQPIYLLIGNLTVKDDVDNNWFDLKNLIISINPQTGTISTNPVHPPYFNVNNPMPYANTPDEASYPNQFDPQNPPKYDWSKPLSHPDNAPFVQALFYSRKFAREAQTMGGKR